MRNSVRPLGWGVFCALIAACSGGAGQGPTDGGGTDTDTETETGDTDTTDPSCPEEGTGEFDEEDPGMRITFTLGDVVAMDTKLALAVAMVTPTAREDFEWGGDDEVPLDSCEVVGDEAPVPECGGPEDCAPEQECVPEYDDGNPVPGTEHCETPREPMDVGPITIDGFEGGSLDLSYNPEQSGAYTTSGGDGTIDPALLAYDADYIIEGAGSPDAGIEDIHGEMHMPAALELTSPELVTTAMGMPAVEVQSGQTLALEWTQGADPDGFLEITLGGGTTSGDSGSIICRVADDGSFEIPAGMVAEAHLGPMAMLNVLMMKRHGSGQLCGDGLTSQGVWVEQVLVLYAVAVEE